MWPAVSIENPFMTAIAPFGKVSRNWKIFLLEQYFRNIVVKKYKNSKQFYKSTDIFLQAPK
jgi:hypothetical protein